MHPFAVALVLICSWMNFAAAQNTQSNSQCNSLQCKADEECRTINNVTDCYCKVPVTDVSEIHPVVTCTSYQIQASFSKCQLSSLNDINLIALYLMNSGCFSMAEDNTTNTLMVSTPLSSSNCNTQLNLNSTYAVYTKTFFLTPVIANVIVRDRINVNVSCSYPLNMRTSLNTVLQPVLNQINITGSGNGSLTVKMAVYQDSSYTTPYAGPLVQLSTTKMLYVGVFLDTDDVSPFALVMKNCYATPSSNPDDPMKYYIIQNSCRNSVDNTIVVYQNGQSSQGQFAVKMFQFINDQRFVYLHCQVYLCDKTKNCVPTCNARAAQIDNTPAQFLSLGPFFNPDGNSAAAGTCVSSGALILSAFISARLAF